MIKKILPKKLIEKHNIKKKTRMLKRSLSDARVNMLKERAMFYGYKPFNFNKFMLKTLKIAIWPVCAVALAGIIFATYIFGATVSLGKDNPEQVPFAINEFNAINAKIKNEMVIGTADASGHVTEIKDRVTLSNVDQQSVYIKDKTTLTNIENINGDEKLEVHDGYVFFENKKKDIVYEGVGIEKMPVGVNVSYFLDGKKLSPDKIAGKSGHVTIRFEYFNNTVNSEYVPYVAMSAVVLDTEKFSNIKTNANAMSVGYNVLAYGGTIPGLREFVSGNGHSNINIDVDDFVQIEADTTNFAIDYTYTVFSNGFAKSIKDETLNNIESATGVASAIDIPTDKITSYISGLIAGTDLLADAMKKLESGSEQLVDASGKVVAGSTDLRDGAAELSGGIRNLADGAAKLAEGSTEVVEGADELMENADEYKNGLDFYAQRVKDLNAGIEELNSKLTFMPGLSAVLKEIAKFLKDLESFTGNISSYSETLITAIDNSIGMEDEETATKLESLLSELSEDGFFMTNMKSISSHIADLLYSIADDVDELYGSAKKIEEGSYKLATSSDDLTKAYGELQSGMEKLDDGINLMDENIGDISDGSEEAAEGAEDIAEGSEEINKSLNKLDSGINNLNKGIKDVSKGFSQFRTGILNINSISIGGSVYTKADNLRYLINCIKQMKLSDAKYFPYSGADENISGTTSYVIKTEGIGK